MTVVGCGGAGCNTLARASERGWKLGHHVALNTDAQHLLETRAHRKVLLGRSTTGGRGTNMDVALGESACKEAHDVIDDVLAGTEIVIVLAGLGGGTGSGGAPVVADMARRMGCLSVSLSTLPFSVEGPTRRDNAAVGRENLARSSDLAFVLPNDHLMESLSRMSLLEAFAAADEALLEPVRLLRTLLTRSDMPWVRTALGGAGASHLGMGRSNGRRGYGRAFDDAIANLFPPVALGTCTRALVMFRAGPDGPPDDQLLEMVRGLHLGMDPRARTLWGIHREEGMGDDLRVVVMLARGPKR